MLNYCHIASLTVRLLLETVCCGALPPPDDIARTPRCSVVLQPFPVQRFRSVDRHQSTVCSKS